MVLNMQNSRIMKMEMDIFLRAIYEHEMETLGKM
jgi:hypothetical protein